MRVYQMTGTAAVTTEQAAIQGFLSARQVALDADSARVDAARVIDDALRQDRSAAASSYAANRTVRAP